MAQEVDQGSNRRPEFEIRSGNSVTSPLAEDDAGSFLERETQRRKRMLRFYLALLAVPVALGIAVLVFGRSDRKLVMEEIRVQAPPIVQQQVGEQIAPTIKSEVQNQFAPTLEQIAGLQSQQGEVKNELAAARDEINVVEQRQNQTAASLRASQQETETALRRENQSLKTQIDTVAGSVKNSQQETTAALRRESEAIKSEVRADFRALDNGVNQKLRKLDGLDEKLNRLDAINTRLMQLEKQSVEDRVRKLERQVESLNTQIGQLIGGTRPRKPQQPQQDKTPQ